MASAYAKLWLSENQPALEADLEDCTFNINTQLLSLPHDKDRYKLIKCAGTVNGIAAAAAADYTLGCLLSFLAV